jgi:Ca-activated chloride channel family protein
LDVAGSKGENVTIVLLSDGLETCGGNPCKAVENAGKAGSKFTLHVIGFDLSKEDVSQLECTAQAGGGLYFNAENAEQLANALQKTALAPDVPSGRLSVKAMRNGKLEDVSVRVYKANAKEEVAFARTYSSPDTNPRILPVPEGTYDVEIKAIQVEGNPVQRLEGINISGNKPVEKIVDFSTGELSVRVTTNGKLSDSTVAIYRNGTKEQLAGGRTYNSSSSNPKISTIIPGEYDVVISSVEISGRPEHKFNKVVVESGKRTELSHEFQMGTMKVGAVNGSALVDAVIEVVNSKDGKQVAQGRTYTSASSNPKTFDVPPGTYRVQLSAVKLEGKPKKQIEITVETGKTAEKTVDFSTGK